MQHLIDFKLIFTQIPTLLQYLPNTLMITFFLNDYRVGSGARPRHRQA